MKIVYQEGPKHLQLPGGIVATRGEPVEVSAEIGKALIARGDFAASSSETKKRRSAEAEKKEE